MRWYRSPGLRSSSFPSWYAGPGCADTPSDWRIGRLRRAEEAMHLASSAVSEVRQTQTRSETEQQADLLLVHAPVLPCRLRPGRGQTVLVGKRQKGWFP